MDILLLLTLPLVAALLSLLFRRSTRALEIIAAITAPILMLCVLFVAAGVRTAGTVKISPYFAADALGVLVLFMVGIVGTAASFYSIGYFREEVRKEIIGQSRVGQFYILFHLFLAAMFFAILTTSPIVMWISIEATTLSTAFLISFYHKQASMEAGWKYLTVNSIGLLLGFFGSILFFTAMAGSELISWDALLANVSTLDPLIAKIGFAFVLIGYGTKVGLVPMHTWLPDAHSKAPSPVSSLLSGSLLNVALLAILRFKIIADAVLGDQFSGTLLIFFGLLSVAIPAFIILVQKNFKRMLAYSSIEHMGLAALGFGFGGIGVFAALLHMLYHSMAKSVLFLSGGNLLLKYGSTKLENIKGTLHALPVTGVLVVAAFLAITGLPPFGLFFTEISILAAGIGAYPILVFILLALLTLIFVGFLKHIAGISFGETRNDVALGEANAWTVVPIVCVLALLLSVSIVPPDILSSLAHAAANVLSGSK